MQKLNLIKVSCILLIMLISFSCREKREYEEDKPGYIFAIHGGAGHITRDGFNAEHEKIYIDKLTEVLLAGDSILKNGGTALDAVEYTINIMENSPLFNAGKGAVFTEEGVNEMDASIMDGSNLEAGAVASVTAIKNPISAARKVMEQTGHVLLAGQGAEKFARSAGLEIVDPSYFYTEKSWRSYERSKERSPEEKHGTVGAVALDKYGNLAAGTSTGGMTFKMPGRIGDSPIIGAGTYADNKTCAVSATGHGEYFMRNLVAYDISALMKYKGWSLKNASEYVINEKLKKQGGEGGVICVDKDGNVSQPFNTTGMFRGYISSDGRFVVKIFSEDEYED